MAGILVCLVAAAPCPGDAATKADVITITGIVKPAAATAEEAATVRAGGALYRIVNDAKGKIVARDAAGKKAEIKGALAERNGEKWITVSWCALVE